jgi:transposase
MLPRDFGQWSTGYGYCKRWRRADVWVDLLTRWRQQERVRHGRKPAPAAGSVDSQRIKTTTQNADIGYEGNTKTKDARAIVWWLPWDC